jgi:hypothetical protein
LLDSAAKNWYTPLAADIGEEISHPCGNAPYFIATKLEAFRGRGRGDYVNEIRVGVPGWTRFRDFHVMHRVRALQ